MPVLWKRCFRSDTVGYRPPAARPTHTTWFTTGRLVSGCFLFASYDLSQAFNVGLKCAESHVRSWKRRLSKRRIDTRMSRTSCGLSSRVSLDVRSLETIARFFEKEKKIKVEIIFFSILLIIFIIILSIIISHCPKKFWHNFHLHRSLKNSWDRKMIESNKIIYILISFLY